MLDVDEIMQAPERLERALRLVGSLDHALGATLLSDRPIIVGGTAIEFYTLGGYSTQDINLVIADPTPLVDLLREAGFRQEGRHWWRYGLDLVVEISGKVLTYAPTAYDRVIEVQVTRDIRTCITGIEDILTSRLYTGIEERRPNDVGWAYQMVLLHRDRIDWPALETLAAVKGPRILAEVQRFHNLTNDHQMMPSPVDDIAECGLPADDGQPTSARIARPRRPISFYENRSETLGLTSLAQAVEITPDDPPRGLEAR